MATDRGDLAYEHWLDASQKFDYLVLSITLALVTYLASTNVPGAIGWNPATLQLASVSFLLLAALCGLGRLHAHVAILRQIYGIRTSEEMMMKLRAISRSGGSHPDTGEYLTPDDVRG